MNAVLTEAGDVRIALRAQQAMVTGQDRQEVWRAPPACQKRCC